MSLYLQNYGLQKVANEFVVSFQIPQNCDYAVSQDSNNVNLITVTLKAGEKDPSDKFDFYEENFQCVNDVLLVDFELPDGDSVGDDGIGAGIKKPRLRVDDLFQL